MDTVYLYDLSHIRHVRSVECQDVGETVINCDNRNPIMQYGKSPSDLLDIFGFWFTIEKAQSDLRVMGFTQVDKTQWIRLDD